MTADTTTANASRHAEDRWCEDAHADSSVSVTGADTEQPEEEGSQRRKCWCGVERVEQSLGQLGSCHGYNEMLDH